MTMRLRGVLMLLAGLAVMGLASCGHYTCGAGFGVSTCTPSGSGLGGGGFVGVGCYEAIAPTYDGLEVVGFVGIVAEGSADFADSGVDSLLDVDEDIFGPEFGGDLFAGHELAALFDEEHQELQGQAFEADGRAAAVELEAGVIQLEFVKTDFLVGQVTTPG